MKYIFAFCLIVLSLALTSQYSFAQQNAVTLPKVDSVKLKSLKAEMKHASDTGDYEQAAVLGKEMIACGRHEGTMYCAVALMLALEGKNSEARLYYDTALSKGLDTVSVKMAQSFLELGPEPPTFDLDSAYKAVDASADRAAQFVPPYYTNAIVYKLYLEDQGERMMLLRHSKLLEQIKANTIRLLKNDLIRKQRLYALLPDLDKSNTPKDLEAAALILQHGTVANDYWHAHTLAMRAVKLGDSSALWLAAATIDRYLVAKGELQMYGTQTHVDAKTNQLEPAPVNPTITDEERARWHVPPLKDALKNTRTILEQE
jgi:hypothetical protein